VEKLFGKWLEPEARSGGKSLVQAGLLLKMKILILTFYYEPDLCAGSFRATAFVEALEKVIGPADSIEVITTKPNRYSSFSAECEELEIKGNVTIRRIKVPAHKSGLLDQAKSFFVYFKEALKHAGLGGRYSAVFATSSRLFTAFLGAVVARRAKAPLYLDMRDIFVDTMRSIYERSLVKHGFVFLSPIETFTFKSARKINLVSKGFEGYFRKKYNKDYSFFTNGIDDVFADFKPGSRSTEAAVGKTIFTYTGNIGEGQGLEKIVPAIAEKYPDIELRIIGSGGRANVLEKACAGYPNVKMIKPVSREKLHAYYAESDVLFLQLNDYQAFYKVLPSKIFEYAATYKPIVAGVSGYAREFIETYLPGSMVYRPCDIEDFRVKYASFTKEVDIDNRKKFISLFLRRNIMDKMAKDLVGIAR
jgi:glycosyltransferase involved in cell wall biosynthesis